jgi:uncharacterized membrane protein YedE/YeeE
MDTAVALVEAYLNVNGYFTVAEYPVLEASRHGGVRAATDLDVLAFRFPGAGIPCEASKGRFLCGRATPLLASKFSIPTRRDIDLRLIAGAAIFGIGWGIGGYCPGPAIMSLATGTKPVLVFVLAMAAGMFCAAHVERTFTRGAVKAQSRETTDDLELAQE